VNHKSTNAAGSQYVIEASGIERWLLKPNRIERKPQGFGPITGTVPVAALPWGLLVDVRSRPIVKPGQDRVKGLRFAPPNLLTIGRKQGIAPVTHFLGNLFHPRARGFRNTGVIPQRQRHGHGGYIGLPGDIA